MFFERYTSSSTTTDMQGRKVPATKLTIATWSEEELLDFHEVPAEAEAVFRLNAAGYFVLTANQDIYRVEPNGEITLLKNEGFNNIFASRLARCANGKSISAGLAWKKSLDRREYDSIGYWPLNHGRPPRSYNLWQGWGIEHVPGDWSPIYHYILNVLAAGDINTANYILDFCSHIVQRPWEKPRV
ncbi:MAG TPA: hypothetical protein VEK84_04995, partial [Terriglobales bacterium]|nr:hypothetical protein [Terriglobales bacterium]